MTTIGVTAANIRYTDRAAYVQQAVDRSQGRFTVEEITAREAESDRIKLQGSITIEAFRSGKATYMGSSRNNQTIWDPEGHAKTIEQSRQARATHYNSGQQVSIDAVNVDSVLSNSGKVTGGDLKTLSYYGDYLRNEVAAATQAKADITFTGSWGKDRSTNDVNEYVSWLFAAIQEKSQAETKPTASMA